MRASREPMSPASSHKTLRGSEPIDRKGSFGMSDTPKHAADCHVPNDLPRLAPRKAESNKGDYGRVVLIGGSRGMAGAAALAGRAALRSGAGLVRLAVADCCLETVAGFEPSFMTAPLPADADGRIAAAAQ